MSFGTEMLGSLCGSLATLPWQGGIVLGMLLAGITGSVMHCVPMCGPFVLGQLGEHMAGVPTARLCELQRVTGALLLPYHVGRLTTYTGLGAAAGLFGASLAQFVWFGWVSAMLLALAALLFLTQALRRLMPRSLDHVLPRERGVPAGCLRSLARLTGRLDRTSWQGGLALGLALGFLPCGLLYTALTAAAATTGMAAGAAAMFSFGLGTVPALIAVGYAGQTFGRRWQRATRLVAPVVMLMNASLLTLLALRTLMA